MKFNILNRKIHYWGSIIIAIPLLLVISSGILLLLKKDAQWIQPLTVKGVSKEIPTIGFPVIFNTAKEIKVANISSWSDIKRIDIQPGKGMAKVISKNNYEIQIDTETAKVLQVAYRRSDIIESLHDGTWIHENVKYLISLPTGVILFVLLASGLFLFAQPLLVKIRRKKKNKNAGYTTNPLSR
ncbi:MAG: PepSY domain-containing protein [Flavobacterium sp.]|nr:PepSY domain-containing protein [Pedobacter sp.]